MPRFEQGFERALFMSRWLMAPIYAGLVVALGAVAFVFVRDLAQELSGLLVMDVQSATVMALSLVDLSLIANLMLIVIFAGYENFVSKIDTAGHEDRPDWMGSIDFGSVKMKLIASVIAISAILLLKQLIYMSEGKPTDEHRLMWMVAIQLAFVASGVLMALMDRLKGRGKG
jgi:uncharacterized protein (TIGR00645 family)